MNVLSPPLQWRPARTHIATLSTRPTKYVVLLHDYRHLAFIWSHITTTYHESRAARIHHRKVEIMLFESNRKIQFSRIEKCFRKSQLLAHLPIQRFTPCAIAALDIVFIPLRRRTLYRCLCFASFVTITLFLMTHFCSGFYNIYFLR